MIERVKETFLTLLYAGTLGFILTMTFRPFKTWQIAINMGISSIILAVAVGYIFEGIYSMTTVVGITALVSATARFILSIVFMLGDCWTNDFEGTINKVIFYYKKIKGGKSDDQ